MVYGRFILVAAIIDNPPVPQRVTQLTFQDPEIVFDGIAVKVAATISLAAALSDATSNGRLTWNAHPIGQP